MEGNPRDCFLGRCLLFRNIRKITSDQKKFVMNKNLNRKMLNCFINQYNKNSFTSCKIAP